MTNADSPRFPPSWQLPAFHETILGPRIHDHALVIPVINEGARIRRQLLEIKAERPDIDVVIADGGSTDGSLVRDILAEAGVRALLVKTGPGRLSAQLRMAYGWCLQQGYQGIVTVDGNGKDGMAAIPRFVAALRQGYGYVQGSRYIAGGQAINTPLDRKLAGRLIHAPMLSLSGRRWFTDTTNGFRGYARDYLLDPRVAPFRDVFQRYELLFYLTVRAGQLGYRTCEVPVTRAYPPATKAPTKIAGWRGRVAILNEMFGAAIGRYTPRDAA